MYRLPYRTRRRTLGNFVNQEAFGGKTDSFLGMTGGRIQEYILKIPHHSEVR